MSKNAQTDVVLPRWLVVGFAGHRHLAEPELVAQAIQQAIAGLATRHCRLAGISSAAIGGDTLFAEEMLRRGYPITIVLPFSSARFKEDFAEDPDGWARSQALMRAAVEVDVVQTVGGEYPMVAPPAAGSLDGTPEAPTNVAYMEAGVRTVDGADVLIAVWDEQPAKGLGGTADTVAYATAIGLPLIVIDPATGRIIDERLDQLPAPARAAEPPGAIENAKALVLAYFDSVNRQAEQCAPLVRQLVRVCVWLHLAAASLAAAAIVFRAEKKILLGVAILEVAVLGAAFVMLAIRGRSHRTWRRLRAEAEVCRSFLATWDIGRHVSSRQQPRPALSGMSDLFNTLRLLRRMDPSPVVPFEHARSEYTRHRVLDQIDYFERKHDEARAQSTWRGGLMAFCTAGAMISSTVLAVILATRPDWSRATHGLEFLAIALPLAATAGGVLLITDESSRRSVRYAEMVQALNHLLPRLQATRTWDSLARIASRVEEELLQEILEWRSFVRHTEHLH